LLYTAVTPEGSRVPMEPPRAARAQPNTAAYTQRKQIPIKDISKPERADAYFLILIRIRCAHTRGAMTFYCV
jgi:hypothetical protein